jgi:hypothetical protein
VYQVIGKSYKKDKKYTVEKAGIKALKRAVELGAFTQEKLELWLK